jgi:putative membrane protein
MKKTLLTVALLAAIASPAIAQTGTAAAAKMTTTLSSNEKQHDMETLQLGTLALETSRIAQQKATNRYVKMFADSEVTEQTTIAEVIKSMNPAAAPALTTQQQTILTGLRNAESGAAFDRMYIKAQLDGHRQLLKAQEDYLNGGDVLAHINAAKLARGQISDHIKALEMIQAALQ